jgi:hypothetical protein
VADQCARATRSGDTAHFAARVLSPQWDYPQGPVAGLGNTGNICFANAAVQLLASVPAIANLALARVHVNYCRDDFDCVADTLESTIWGVLAAGSDQSGKRGEGMPLPVLTAPLPAPPMAADAAPLPPAKLALEPSPFVAPKAPTKKAAAPKKAAAKPKKAVKKAAPPPAMMARRPSLFVAPKAAPSWRRPPPTPSWSWPRQNLARRSARRARCSRPRPTAATTCARRRRVFPASGVYDGF